jgi:hypothetical protein
VPPPCWDGCPLAVLGPRELDRHAQPIFDRLDAPKPPDGKLRLRSCRWIPLPARRQTRWPRTP